MRIFLSKLSCATRYYCLIALSVCLCAPATSCARKPALTPRAALDYGQFALRQLPPDIDLHALEGKRIVIDPGHGGIFPGAVGPNTLTEADVNLGVGLYLWGMLKQAGAEAHLTRADDAVVYKGIGLTLKQDLHARAELAETYGADLFVSLHHNADVLPDKKKNSLETYFKMSDPGPSLDVAKNIHRQLALSLKQEDNVILPGNFHVLRENATTAVLGEPSYISHAENAFRLGLAPMQRMEAQAYFLGIAEYFSRGIPKIEDMEPGGVIDNNPRPLITARVLADRDVAIDPNSIMMLIDGKPVIPEFNPASSQATYLPPERFTNGKHLIQISLRNVNGNASTPKEHEIEIAMPPAYILMSSNIGKLRPGSTIPIRLSARLLDRDLMPVADGMPVEFKASTGTVSPDHSLTKNGRAAAYFLFGKDPQPLEISVTATAAGLSRSLELSVSADAPEIVAVNVLDDNTGQPVENALATIRGRPLGYSDRSGYFAMISPSARDLVIAFSHLGYESQKVKMPNPGTVQTVRLRPMANGILFGQRFALDPEFGGEEKGAIGPTGTRASDLNLDVANHLARFLQSSGASVVLTRESDNTVNTLRRVEIAEKFGAQWFICISHGEARRMATSTISETGETGILDTIKVKHYPKSQLGEKLASSIAGMLRTHEIAAISETEPDTSFILTHTSGAAVTIGGLTPDTPAAEEKLTHPGAARNEAYAIYCGILESFGLKEETTGRISASVFDKEGNRVPGAMLRLDGALTFQSNSRGELTFYRLIPGEHNLEIFSDGLLIWSGMIQAKAGSDTSVDISISGPTIVSTSSLK